MAAVAVALPLSFCCCFTRSRSVSLSRSRACDRNETNRCEQHPPISFSILLVSSDWFCVYSQWQTCWVGIRFVYNTYTHTSIERTLVRHCSDNSTHLYGCGGRKKSKRMLCVCVRARLSHAIKKDEMRLRRDSDVGIVSAVSMGLHAISRLWRDASSALHWISEAWNEYRSKISRKKKTNFNLRIFSDRHVLPLDVCYEKWRETKNTSNRCRDNCHVSTRHLSMPKQLADQHLSHNII